MKNLIYSFLAISLLTACSGKQGDGTTDSDKKTELNKFGGTLKLAKSEQYGDLHPHFVKDVNSLQLVLNIFESLLKFNSKTLEIENGLAESVEKKDGNTRYIIKLKKGVKFHDDPCFNNGKGREVTADDVKYSFEQLCTNKKGNSVFQSSFKDIVVGANEYFDGDSEQLTGVQILDDYTVEIKLIQSYPAFDYILASLGCSVIPKEGVEKYSNQLHVGTGPFVYESSLDKADGITLLRNNNYHIKDESGRSLPYLDTLSFVYTGDKHQQWKLFKSGELDYIESVPSDEVRKIMEAHKKDFENQAPKYAEFILGVDNLMSTMFLSFNVTKRPLNNKKVRQALAYAIDRNRIIDDILRGGAKGPAHNGITPAAVNPKYNTSSIEGYNFNPKKARQLLAEAGYPSGKGFPSFKLKTSSSGGEIRGRVAFEIAHQWKSVLGINVELDIVPSLKQIIRDEASGSGDAYISGWVADFPSPENFLTLGYGKHVAQSDAVSSWPNSSRYMNPDFDQLYEKARRIENEQERLNLFLEAEKILMADVPICPLWYADNYNIRHSELWNFYTNGMELFDFSRVYKKERLVQDKPKNIESGRPL